MIRTMVYALAALRWVGPLGAQMVLGGATPPAGVDAFARVDSLHTSFDPRASLEAAEALATADSGDVGAAWRAARAAVALGMLAEEEAQQNAWYLRGEVHAARAVAADSLSLDALFWFTAAKGQLAVQASVRDAARLGQEVWRLAHRMLAIDPDHAGTHNVLGRLQYEVMTLSRIERFLARMILGSNEALRSSSWEGAERHQLRAVALDPEQILYRYDLARIHMRRGRPREAEAELGTALALPARTPPDFRIHTDARRQLARLEARR